MFDARLVQSTRVLVSLVDEPLSELNAFPGEPIVLRGWHGQAHGVGEALAFNDGHAYENKLAFQVWDAQGRLLLRSDSAPARPLATLKAGYEDVVVDSAHWRAFTLRSPNGRWFQSAELTDIREELAGDIAGGTLLPLLLSLPLIALLVWWSVALATHSYVLQLLRYVFLISLSIGWACEIMVGRLIGAGRFRAAHALVRKAVRNGMLTSGLVALAAALAAPWLLRVFTHDPQVIESAQTLLWIAVVLEVGRVFNLILPGALRASGDADYPVVAGIGSYVLVLGVGSYFMGRAYGLPGIFIVYAADEWARGLMMMARWQMRGWLRYACRTRRDVRSR